MAKLSENMEELCDLMDFLSLEDLPSPDELRSDMAPQQSVARVAEKKTNGVSPSRTQPAHRVQNTLPGISAGPKRRPLRAENRRPCAAPQDLRDVINARRSQGNNGHIKDLRDILRRKKNINSQNNRTIAYGRYRGIENFRSCATSQDLRDVLTARRRGRNGPYKNRRRGGAYAPW